MTHISTPTTLSQLVARSRKLGADRSICNWGGGNTSAKSDEIDFRGRPARVLWVKGSGSDLATVTEASFTGLFLEDVLSLLERERMSDSEMVDYLAHCFYEPGRMQSSSFWPNMDSSPGVMPAMPAMPQPWRPSTKHVTMLRHVSPDPPQVNVCKGSLAALVSTRWQPRSGAPSRHRSRPPCAGWSQRKNGRFCASKTETMCWLLRAVRMRRA